MGLSQSQRRSERTILCSGGVRLASQRDQMGVDSLFLPGELHYPDWDLRVVQEQDCGRGRYPTVG